LHKSSATQRAEEQADTMLPADASEVDADSLLAVAVHCIVLHIQQLISAASTAVLSSPITPAGT
jgi:hypothetical protein